MRISPESILIRPLVTEKSTGLKDDFRQYAFVVAPAAAKGDIARAVEDLFKVSVTKVRTIPMRGKLRRMGKFQGYRRTLKKAIVTVGKDQKIDFEGLP